MGRVSKYAGYDKSTSRGLDYYCQCGDFSPSNDPRRITVFSEGRVPKTLIVPENGYQEKTWTPTSCKRTQDDRGFLDS